MKNIIIIASANFERANLDFLTKENLNSLGKELKSMRLGSISIYGADTEEHNFAIDVIANYLSEAESYCCPDFKAGDECIDYIQKYQDGTDSILMVISHNFAEKIALACADFFLERKNRPGLLKIKSCEAVLIDLSLKNCKTIDIPPGSMHNFRFLKKPHK